MKPARRLLIVVGLWLVGTTASAQNLQTTIKIQAMEMARALVNNDFDAFSKYVHPSVLQLAGSKEKLKHTTDSVSLVMRTMGIKFKKILIGDPGPIVNSHNQLQSVVPQSTDIQTPMGNMHTESSLIALSSDNGKKWYFVDTNMYHGDKLKKLLPELSSELVIPPQKKPVFTPTGQ